MGVVEELRAEQGHIDRAYARLDELRSSASSLAEEVVGLGRGGSLADRVDRDARVQLALARDAALSVGDRSLCFGRLDTEGEDRLHIGRLGVSDEAGEPLMLDWRAPAAEAFYRATSADRRVVVRRRHIRMMVADPVEVAAAKADLAMAERLSQAVRSHQRPLDEVAHVGYSIHRLALTPADTARLVTSAGAEPTYRAGRAKLEGLLLRYLWCRVERAERRATGRDSLDGPRPTRPR